MWWWMLTKLIVMIYQIKSIKSLCCTSKINAALNVIYISIKKKYYYRQII